MPSWPPPPGERRGLLRRSSRGAGGARTAGRLRTSPGRCVLSRRRHVRQGFRRWPQPWRCGERSIPSRKPPVTDALATRPTTPSGRAAPSEVIARGPRCGSTSTSRRRATPTSRPACSSAGDRYRELRDQALAIAGWLQARGVKQGDRVAVHAELPAVRRRAVRHPARRCGGGAGQPDEPRRRVRPLHHRPRGQGRDLQRRPGRHRAQANAALPRAAPAACAGDALCRRHAGPSIDRRPRRPTPPPSSGCAPTRRCPGRRRRRPDLDALAEALAEQRVPGPHTPARRPRRCCPTPRAPPACPRAACTPTSR